MVLVRRGICDEVWEMQTLTINRQPTGIKVHSESWKSAILLIDGPLPDLQLLPLCVLRPHALVDHLEIWLDGEPGASILHEKHTEQNR